MRSPDKSLFFLFPSWPPFYHFFGPLSPPSAMLEHLKKGLDPEQLAVLHPRVSERMARTSEGVRNRLEEARRMNVDELKELQRLATSI